MIRIIRTFSCLALILLTLYSCQESEPKFDFQTNEESSFLDPKDCNNEVTIEKVMALFNGIKGTRSSIDIDCVLDEAKDTLLYVYNKPEGGWIIFSTDNRVPAIIAESDSGSFSELMKNESANLWIQSLAGDMKTIKMLDDKNLNFTSAEINKNRDFWNFESLQLESDIQNVNLDGSVSDKNGHDDWPPLILEHKGHYEYGYTDIYTETYDSIRKLTNTYWHQNSPHNNYCPYISQRKIVRAPAGCVAIAAAQVLFFLNQRFGFPQMAPSKAYCNGTIEDQNYDWAQTDYNSEIWYDMWINPAYSAPLIADIGRRLNIKYGREESKGTIKDIPKNVFKPYGISSTYSDYNVDKLKNSLLNGLPVILRADRLNPESESGKSGHAFIADRYKRVRIRREAHYIWTWDPNPYTGPITEQPLLRNRPDSVVVSYLSPEINMIGMNWGWGLGSNTDREWFTLTGDWIKDSSGENYNIDRAMVYINSINF